MVLVVELAIPRIYRRIVHRYAAAKIFFPAWYADPKSVFYLHHFSGINACFALVAMVRFF